MLARTEALAHAAGLTVLGGFHPDATDSDLPKGTRTLLLLGPDEPAFWDIFTASPEHADALPDPMDRWSRRVIGRIACDLSAKALFPFGGPPYRPFLAWAMRSGSAWSSPVGLLVHHKAGLMVPFRGALALRDTISLPAPPTSPCLACDSKPCRTACPVGALGAGGYDVPRCKDFLSTEPGADCMTQGCAVRRACPLSQSYPRRPEQSAFHMRAFHPT